MLVLGVNALKGLRFINVADSKDESCQCIIGGWAKAGTKSSDSCF